MQPAPQEPTPDAQLNGVLRELVAGLRAALGDNFKGAYHSKPASAAWAQAQLDPRWAGLIERAWVERQDA